MGYVWALNPANGSKRYMTEEKFAILDGSGWTITTAPEDGYVPPDVGFVTGEQLATAIAGKANLSGGKVAVAELPSLAVVDYLGGSFSQAHMLTLTGQRGDWCYRTDTGTDWQIVGDNPASLGSWVERHYPAAKLTQMQDLDQTGAAVGKVVAVATVSGGVVTGWNVIDIPSGYSDEQARDAVGTALVGGANLSVTVNDAADTITLAVSGLAPVATAGTYTSLTGKPTIPATYTDLSGTVPTTALPALSITDVFPVASQAAMLALTAQRGDVAVRSDIAKTFILAADAPATLASWVEMPAIGAVQSVAGRQGVVTLAKGDVGLGSVDNTSDAAKPVSTAQQTALNGKTALSVDNLFTGTYNIDTTPVTPAQIGAATAAETAAIRALLAAVPGSSSSLWSGGGAETLSRFGTVAIAGTSGRLHLMYVTAPVTVTISQLTMQTFDVVSTGATVARMALFTVAGNGDLTKVAQTANNTALATAQYSQAVAPFNTTGGFPGNYTLTAGQRYAFGWLNVATTPATMKGQIADLSFIAPIVNKIVNGQTDIAAGYTDASLAGSNYQPLLMLGMP